MFKNVLIFFSIIFFFLSLQNESKGLTGHQISKIKKKAVITNFLIKKVRNEKNILKPKKYQKSKIIFDLINEKKWNKANKYAKNDVVLKKIIEWHYLNQSNKNDFFRIKKFIENNPNWPNETFFRKKMELVIERNFNNKEIIQYFEKNKPLTTKGNVNYLDSLRKEKGLKNIEKEAKYIWINKKFSKKQSRDFYKRYKKILTNKDHIKRIENLTWSGRYYEARRMLPIINKNKKDLYNARIILRRRAGNVDQAISRINKNLLNDQGLIYERLRWRRKSRLYETAFDLIDPLPENIKYEKKWWLEISIIVRKLLEKKEYKKAYRLVKDFSTKSNEYLSESEWYAGWIAYEFLNVSPEIYVNHFLNSFENTNHIGEKAKSAYWAGRSYEKIKNKELSELWYKNSANYITEFYGQLSFEKINKKSTLITNEELYGKNILTKDDIEFTKTDLYKASELILANGTRKNAKKFITHLINNSKTPGELQIIAKLSKDLGRLDLSIKTSKFAKRKGFNLFHYAYPSIKNYKIHNKIEKELVFGVIRQESVFDTKAKSRVGARGIMQIMPATAKKVSKELNLSYSKRRLINDPQYNITIGSNYLYDLIKEYDSYLLALIGYNAGPRRINRWIKKNGDPRKKNVDPISWIEKIPIKETRLYVKFVLSNMQIYRQKNEKNKKLSIFSTKYDI